MCRRRREVTRKQSACICPLPLLHSAPSYGLFVVFIRWFKFFRKLFRRVQLTHWGRVTHICVSYLTIIGSDNGLSPGRRQAIIRTNAGILLIRPLGTNFSEILIKILIFSLKKMRLKVSSAKRRPFCLGLNVLMTSHHGITSWLEPATAIIWSIDSTFRPRTYAALRERVNCFLFKKYKDTCP